jgi:hypothetical protein
VEMERRDLPVRQVAVAVACREVPQGQRRQGLRKNPTQLTIRGYKEVQEPEIE